MIYYITTSNTNDGIYSKRRKNLGAGRRKRSKRRSYGTRMRGGSMAQEHQYYDYLEQQKKEENERQKNRDEIWTEFMHVQKTTNVNKLKNFRQIFSEKITLQYLKGKGVSASQLINEDFKVFQLKDAGFSVGELLAAGVSIPELKLNYRDEKYIKEFKKAGVTVDKLLDVGFLIPQLKLTYNVEDFKNAGFDVDKLLDFGYKADELKSYFTALELKTNGVTESDLLESGFNPEQLKEAGIDDNVILRKPNKFTSEELKKAGLFTFEKLIKAFPGITVESAILEFKATPEQLTEAGFDSAEIERYIEKDENTVPTEFKLMYLEQDMVEKYKIILDKHIHNNNNEYITKFKENIDKAYKLMLWGNVRDSPDMKNLYLERMKTLNAYIDQGRAAADRAAAEAKLVAAARVQITKKEAALAVPEKPCDKYVGMPSSIDFYNIAKCHTCGFLRKQHEPSAIYP